MLKHVINIYVIRDMCQSANTMTHRISGLHEFTTYIAKATVQVHETTRKIGEVAARGNERVINMGWHAK